MTIISGTLSWRLGLFPASVAACLGTLLPVTAHAQGLPVYTASHLPLALWSAGAAVLGLVLIYGISRNRRRTNSERHTTEKATKDLYREEDRKERDHANSREV